MEGCDLFQSEVYAADAVRNYRSHTPGVLLVQRQFRILQGFLDGDKCKMRHAVGMICQFTVEVLLDCEVFDFPCHLYGQVLSGEVLDWFNTGVTLACRIPESFFADTVGSHNTKSGNNDPTPYSI
jgi:hypothetical protein